MFSGACWNYSLIGLLLTREINNVHVPEFGFASRMNFGRPENVTFVTCNEKYCSNNITFNLCEKVTTFHPVDELTKRLITTVKF